MIEDVKRDAVSAAKFFAAGAAAALPALALLVAPHVAAAADQLVDGSKEASGYTWTYFLEVLQNVSTFLIKLAVMTGAGFIMWAGFLYATAGGDTGKVSEAHRIFKNVALGIALSVGAYMIVAVIIKSLGGLQSGSAQWINIE